jgi:hypothetical protein
MKRPDLDVAEAERWFAVQLNNACWDVLESTTRSREDLDRAIHSAHAACHHWLQIGTEVHEARALVLLANLYAEQGDGPSSLRHGRRCLELTEKNAAEMHDWDLAFAYECVARGHAAGVDREEAKRFKAQAREAGDRIQDPQDKEIFEKGFASRNWYGME